MEPSPEGIEEVMSESDLRSIRSRRFATLTFIRASVVSLTIALGAGLLGAFYYIPGIATRMQRLGIDFTALRPIHTVFAAAFIFLGGVAVVHRYFEDRAGRMSSLERFLLRSQVILWAIAGLGILGSLIAGAFSGREYVGYPPAWSIPIALGWIAFTINFFMNTRRGLFRQPVHITMWAVACLFFLYTFAEQHAWLLPGIFRDPIVDMRIQWKATGTLVGSFNLFVYGSLYFIACKLAGNEDFARSRTAYALFGVGLLNSFTNFGHHTYHLPQSHAVKWISFIISMTEIIILARVIWDVTALIRSRNPVRGDAVNMFMTAGKLWTMFIVGTAIVISVPPLNALIHGTTAVMGHAMGAEIGIDGMVLFAATSWILAEILRRRHLSCEPLSTRFMQFNIIGLNVAVAVLVVWLTINGVIVGYWRYQGSAPPAWVARAHPFMLAGSGSVAAVFLAALLTTWLRVLFQTQRQTQTDSPKQTVVSRRARSGKATSASYRSSV